MQNTFIFKPTFSLFFMEELNALNEISSNIGVYSGYLKNLAIAGMVVSSFAAAYFLRISYDFLKCDKREYEANRIRFAGFKGFRPAYRALYPGDPRVTSDGKLTEQAVNSVRSYGDEQRNKLLVLESELIAELSEEERKSVPKELMALL